MSFMVHPFLTVLLLVGCGINASVLQENNITVILHGMPGYSLFNQLLLRTGVADEINARTSLTILAPNDSIVDPMLNSYVGGGIPTQQVSDILRYHVLLEYFDLSKMRQDVAESGRKDVTTLYQTTGRATGIMGHVNLILEQNGALGVGLPVESSAVAATILKTLKLVPYNISVLQISAMLIPVGIPNSSPPSPSVDIVDALTKAGKFTLFVAFLQATGVDQTFEKSESSEGITIFAPSDDAFAALPPGSNIQRLTAEKKILILKFHALTAFYPLGMLSVFKNPVAPTIATTDPVNGGAGQFTINVTNANGVVILNTGIVSAPVIGTVREEQPVAIFVIDQVLLPEKLFGHRPSSAPAPMKPFVPVPFAPLSAPISPISPAPSRAPLSPPGIAPAPSTVIPTNVSVPSTSVAPPLAEPPRGSSADSSGTYSTRDVCISHITFMLTVAITSSLF